MDKRIDYVLLISEQSILYIRIKDIVSIESSLEGLKFYTEIGSLMPDDYKPFKAKVTIRLRSGDQYILYMDTKLVTDLSLYVVQGWSRLKRRNK